MILPIDSSLLAEMLPTWAISLLVVVGLEAFFSSSTRAGDGLVDAALEVHRVHAGGHVLHAFAHDRLGQHGGGGGAVTGVVAGLGSDFLDHLRAHVLQLVLELDLLGDRHTVLGDGGGAERALEHHVAALGAQRDLDRVGQDVHAFDHADAGVGTENDVFSCHVFSPYFSERNQFGVRRVLREGHRRERTGAGLTSRRRRRGRLRASPAARRHRP
jgi:hypothetical protein